LEEEQRRPEEDWRSAGRMPIFVAIREGKWVGMAGCFAAPSDQAAVVWGMWVEPESRRSGLGKRLLEAAMGWARSEGFHRVRLSVAEANVEAAELYRGAGFTPTGKRSPLASDPSVMEVELEREL
jgi:ribosomal protein S18 acetylase RimI-like enzyme